METWQATKAKQHFSKIIDAVKKEPQLVIRRGKPVGVVISYDEYLNSKSLHEKKSLKNWLSELKFINKTEEEMSVIVRIDREQPDWE
ncbi:MAG: type II toxin-antitoxin system Phd/YefM family antitoxin [Spirochaetales bacterium]|nr:type II toxin-antitoxin system Phd/YefM family antitoxin [Spirochaetales bacterium]